MGQRQEKGQGETTRNLLKDRQLFLAASWVATNDITGFPTYQALADKVTEVMGFKVTEGNVRNLLHVTEKRLPAYDPPATQEQTLERLKAEVAELTTRMANVCQLAEKAFDVGVAAGQLFMVYGTMVQAERANDKPKAHLLRTDLPDRTDKLGELLAGIGALPVVLDKGK